MADIKIEREYYSIAEASSMLGCSVRDLVHLGAINKLSLFVLLDKRPLKVRVEDQEIYSLYGQYDWRHTGLAMVKPVDLVSMESDNNRQSILTRVSSLREEPTFVTEYIQKATDGFISEFIITYELLEDLIFNRDDLIVLMADMKHFANKNITEIALDKSTESISSYSTDLIKMLNLAINEFYIPRRSTDPKKDEVAEWLKSKGKFLKVNVSNNMADAIFTIIKPDDHNPKIKRVQPKA